MEKVYSTLFNNNKIINDDLNKPIDLVEVNFLFRIFFLVLVTELVITI